MAVQQVEELPCPACGGRGWVVEVGRGAGMASRCACREAALTPSLLAAAGIPDRYRECRLSNFRVPTGSPDGKNPLLDARAAAQRYCNDFLTVDGFCRTGLLFIGPPGTGKTHLAVAVLIELVERYRTRGRFVELPAFFNQLTSTFGSASGEPSQAVLAPLMDSQLLVLDELGSQQPTPWIRDVLYLVINARYSRRLPTLFTTNYRLPVARSEAPPSNVQSLDRGRDPDPLIWDEAQALASRLPAMLVSRLYEMTQPVLLNAVEDFRREQSVQRVRRR